MGSLPEVRREDARTPGAERSVLEGARGFATLRHRQPILSESGGFVFGVLYSEVYPVHRPIPFPQNHHHRDQFQGIPLS